MESLNAIVFSKRHHGLQQAFLVPRQRQHQFAVYGEANASLPTIVNQHLRAGPAELSPKALRRIEEACVDYLVVPRAGFIANHGVLLNDHDFPAPECKGPSNGQPNYASADHDAVDFVQESCPSTLS